MGEPAKRFPRFARWQELRQGFSWLEWGPMSTETRLETEAHERELLQVVRRLPAERVSEVEGSQRWLEKMADEVRAGTEAGRTQWMVFTEDSEIEAEKTRIVSLS